MRTLMLKVRPAVSVVERIERMGSLIESSPLTVRGSSCSGGVQDGADPAG